jgi:malate dehydrogenase
MKKITIIGAGRVGEMAAQIIAEKEMCDEIAMIDVREGAAAGAALDIYETTSLSRFDTRLTGGTEPALMSGSELVIITAGSPRKPGMSRSDVLGVNLAILRTILDQVLEFAPQAMLLIVSNPVDALTYHAWKHTGWDRKRIFGLAGVLDSARMSSFVALETGFSGKDITSLVLGGHGDTMVPLTRFTCINGIPITHLLDTPAIERIIERTREGGAEVLGLKQTSSAYNAPGASIAAMVDSISRNRKRILACVCPLEGEYGQHDVAIGVPVVLGRSGIERIVELPLNADEMEMLNRSASQARSENEP